MKLDKHAIVEGAKFLHEQALAIEIVHGRGFKQCCGSGVIEGLMNGRRHSHYCEMASRLLAMLPADSLWITGKGEELLRRHESKGACRRKAPAITRKKQRKQR